MWAVLIGPAESRGKRRNGVSKRVGDRDEKKIHNVSARKASRQSASIKKFCPHKPQRSFFVPELAVIVCYIELYLKLFIDA